MSDILSSAEILAALHLTGENVRWVLIHESVAVYEIETEVDDEIVADIDSKVIR